MLLCFAALLPVAAHPVLDFTVLRDLPLWRILAALTVLSVSLLGKNLFQLVLAHLILRLGGKEKKAYEQHFLTAVKDPFAAAIVLLGLTLAAQFLFIGVPAFERVEHWIAPLYEGGIGLILIWTVFRLVDVVMFFVARALQAHDPAMSGQVIPLLRNLLKILVLILGLLTLLATFQINVMSLLAGLGVGGLAVALALQDPLGNFFGTLTLLSDHPFRVGDWIQYGNPGSNRVDGVVEKIGMRSTRIRTFAQTLLTVPNSLLTKDILENLSAMPKRRVRQTVVLSYQSDPGQLRTFLQSVRENMLADEDIDPALVLVHLQDTLPQGCEILIYYFTHSLDWPHHLQTRERITLRILELAREQNLLLATNSNASMPVRA